MVVKALLDMGKEYRVLGYVGKWSVIDTATIKGCKYALLEHCTYGDETCYLVVPYKATFVIDEKGRSVIDTPEGETYDDLYQWAEDELN